MFLKKTLVEYCITYQFTKYKMQYFIVDFTGATTSYKENIGMKKETVQGCHFPMQLEKNEVHRRHFSISFVVHLTSAYIAVNSARENSQNAKWKKAKEECVLQEVLVLLVHGSSRDSLKLVTFLTDVETKLTMLKYQRLIKNQYFFQKTSSVYQKIDVVFFLPTLILRKTDFVFH